MLENEHLGPHRGVSQLRLVEVQSMVTWHDPWETSSSQSPPSDHFCVFIQGCKMQVHGLMGPHRTKQCEPAHDTHTLTCGDTRGRSKVGPPYQGGIGWCPYGGPRLPALLHRLPTCRHAALLILDVDLRHFQWRCIQGWRDGEHMDRWRSTPSTPPINMCCIHPLKTWFIQVRN
jgi:hypothetical protein